MTLIMWSSFLLEMRKKETINFDDLLDGVDIKILYRIHQHF